MTWMRHVPVCVVVGLVVIAGLTAPAAGQLSDRGPQFYYVATPGAAPIDARNSTIFKQHLALHLTDVSVDDALLAIGAQTGLHFTYSRDVITLDGTVTIHAEYITLAAALAEVLDDRAIDVQITPSGMARLVKREATTRGAREDGASVRGRVIDAATGVGLGDVQLSLTGVLPDSATVARSKGPLKFHVLASASAVTGKDGRYLMLGIPPGTYALSAHRLSYGPQVDTIVVRRDSQVVTVNFRLHPIAQTLHEVVTTATGQEERYKVGNSVGTIDADSVVQNVPILNVSDLLAARVPGVTVETSSGAVGAPSLIRIRGLSSINGSNDPILIVDGVRVNGNMSAAEVNNLTSPGTPAPSRLDDIDPNSIEKIEVLKGPSASALYGTDAANGVIVITTKRGFAGPAQWSADYTHSWKSVPGSFPWLYYGWGHYVGSNLQNECQNSAVPSCVQDSVERYNPLNNPYTTTIGSAPSNNYDLNVAGGSPNMQYRLTGGVDNQTGVTKLSDYDAYLIRQANGGGSVPGWQLHPNTMIDERLSSNVTIQPSSTLDLAVTTNVIQQTQLDAGDAIGNATDIQQPSDTSFHPSSIIQSKTTTEITRGFGTLNVRWRPATWVDLHAVGGYDYTSREDQSASNNTDCISANCLGQNFVSATTSSTAVTSVDVGGTITWPLHGAISAKTSVGEQYNKSETNTIANSGADIPLGDAVTLNNAASTKTTQNANASATAGWLVQQEFGLNDRLWVSGALRQDAGSAFGSKLQAPMYPKASVSWLLSQEPFFPTNPVLSMVRLRAAYGQSGVQPQLYQAQQVFASTQALVNGNLIPAYLLTGVGNPYLQPERTAEVEGGADIGLFHNRATFDVTLYQRRHYDALIGAQLAPSVGGGSYAENVGNVLDEGLEIGLDQLELVRTRDFGWSVNGGIAFNKNELTTLGNHVLQSNDYSDIRFVPGYPLYGVWARPLLGYTSQNGVVGPNDIVVGDSAVYVGATQPAYEAHWSTNIMVFRVLRINMTFEYQNDLTQSQGLGGVCANGPSSLGANSVHAPLPQQALAQYYNVTFSCLPEVVSFLRFQSAAVSYDLPRRLTRPLHIRSATLMLEARNLALWTSYAGKDPEVNSNPGSDAIADNGVLPQTRDYSFRVRINF
jgi:TonB-linked SusC/RagA family outer membrane protein